MRVKKEVPKKRRKLRKPVLAILLTIPIVTATGIYFSYAQKEEQPLSKIYYKGDIFKANHSANLLDYIKTDNNIVISPYNINTSINGLYNLTNDNEITTYFNLTLEESNELYKTNKETLTYNNAIEKDYEELYLKLVKELEKYNNYTINDIAKLTQEEKQKLILALSKTKLCINSINKIENTTIKFIKQYSLSKEKLNINDHAIYNMLMEYLDDYETYNYKQNVTNYNELIYNKELVTKPKKKSKKITLPKIDNVTLSGVSYLDKTNTVNELNNKVREITNNKVRYVIKETNINNNDLIYLNSFNFESIWQNNFKKEYIEPGEFTTYNKKIEIVDFLYETIDRYYENNNAKAFKKDFQNGKYSFVGILPKEKGEFDLSNIDIEGLLNKKIEKETIISIPKFSFQYELNLTEFYKTIGIEKTLKQEIELKNLTEKVTLNHMISKVSITIDEKGTNKSLVTNSFIETKELKETNSNILLDRPFAFLIMDNETNNILLIGKVINPNEA